MTHTDILKAAGLQGMAERLADVLSNRATQGTGVIPAATPAATPSSARRHAPQTPWIADPSARVGQRRAGQGIYGTMGVTPPVGNLLPPTGQR